MGRTWHGGLLFQSEHYGQVDAMRFSLIGIGIGGALGLTRFLSSLLYGIKPTDPLTFVIVSLVLRWSPVTSPRDAQRKSIPWWP